MIQNFSTFKKQVSDFNSLISDQAQIQKIYSTSFYICLSIRLPGVTKYLYLGRGSGYEGLWVGDEKPKPLLRKKNRFLEYLRKHISSCRLIGLELPFSDRLVVIHYMKWGKLNKLILFYKGRDLDIIHHHFEEKGLKFFSNRNIDFNSDSIIDEKDLHSLYGNSLQSYEEKEIKNISHELILEDEENKVQSKSGSKKQKFLKRKKAKIEKDLEKVKKWPLLKEKADNFYVNPFDFNEKIEGIKLNFKDSDSNGKNLDLLYKKIKGFQKAEEILNKRIKETKECIESSSQLDNKIKAIIVLPPKKNETKELEIQKNFEIRQLENFSLGFGVSAQGNDQLRKQWAKKEDIWFHLNNESSVHVIIKGVAIHDLVENHFELVGKIIKEKMKSSKDEFDLVYTQVKNIKGVKASPGSVTLKKQKYRRIFIK